MNELHNVLYIQEILSQSDNLSGALDAFDAAALKPLREKIQSGTFDRILLTGMGASLFASYPIWLQLINAGLPVYWIDCAELIHHARPLVTKRALVWIASQSGRSAEVAIALDIVKQAGATLMATVNDLNSPLAQAAQHLIPIHAQVEKTVSTRTYVNTLAVSQLAALMLTNGDVNKGLDELRFTAEGIKDYLREWESHLETMRARVIQTPHMYLLGRGCSLAAAYTGALILGEASKVAATGMHAAEFRHGPMELASDKLSALIFAGPAETAELNARLHRDLSAAGVHALWIGNSDGDQVEPRLAMPRAIGIGVPLAEIIPIQMLTILKALENNLEPGKFFRSGKVTLAE